MVAKGKEGITVVGSIWADGRRGPVYIHTKAGFWPEEQRLAFNKAHWGRCYVSCSGIGTHFMNGRDTYEMYKWT